MTADGVNPICYQFVYKENLGQSSVKLITEHLHKYISNNISEPELNIVALSQGGIIARYYISHYSDKKINKCITICTPHSGSWVAYLGSSPGIKELRPHSSLLKELDTHTAYVLASKGVTTLDDLAELGVDGVEFCGCHGGLLGASGLQGAGGLQSMVDG